MFIYLFILIKKINSYFFFFFFKMKYNKFGILIIHKSESSVVILTWLFFPPQMGLI